MASKLDGIHQLDDPEAVGLLEDLYLLRGIDPSVLRAFFSKCGRSTVAVLLQFWTGQKLAELPERSCDGQ